MSAPQLLLDVHAEGIHDLFAGGGGASCGIELALGRSVDTAINHDPVAIALHKANHPTTDHFTSDVFEVDPREAAKGRPVGFLWASPDCTFHSKARGAKPIRSREKKRRALAWVVKRWAAQVRPTVIALENVEEFSEWGPLIARRDESGRVVRSDGTVAGPGERTPEEDQELIPDPARRGETFQRFVDDLKALGYAVEWKELRASDFGAPTTRKRLFLVARCDGRPIVWPKPTHGPRSKGRKPVRTAAECIDWAVPMLSIFATRAQAKAWAKVQRKAGWDVRAPQRPLKPATLRRIARGVVKFVIEGEPYIVGDAASFMVPRYGERPGQDPRTLSLEEPYPAVVPTANGGMLVSAFLAKHYGGVVGVPLDQALGTVTTVDHHSLVTAHLQRDFGASVGSPVGVPVGAITAGGGGKTAIVASFLQKYHGQGTGLRLDEPASTITTKDRLGLVTVTLAGEPWVIVDIAMRMLQPHELFRCQGFPESYRIDTRFFDEEKGKWRTLTKGEQVRMVGNSVPPHLAAAIIAANRPDMIVSDEAARRWVA